MKTSNKLLISIAVLFFMVPLLGMMIRSKMYYKSYNVSFNADQSLNNQSFKEKTPGRKAIVINEPFYAVNLVDANNSSVELHLNHEDNYGVKVQDDLADKFGFKVENEVLNISFKDGFSINDYRNRVMVTVYAPKFKEVSANHTFNLNIITITDSLNIKLQNCGFFSTGKDGDLLTVTKLVNGDTVKHETFNGTQFKNLNIFLDHSKMAMSPIDLNHLNISAQNNSTVEMEGAGPNVKESVIEHFKLITLGKNEIKINNFNLKELKGEISDDTKLEVPTSMLKRLFK